MTQEELAVIREATLLPALRAAADCFEFACHTGLAYQDMCSLTPASVRLIEGHHWETNKNGYGLLYSHLKKSPGADGQV
ncbi:hypothetical protein [Spirosoma jeollabukense]